MEGSGTDQSQLAIPEHDNHRLSLPTSFFVEALYPFNGQDTASLSFQKGDIIEVLTQLPSGWWDGVMWRQRERGWFPSNYTRRLTDEEAEFTRAQLETITQAAESSILDIQHPAELTSRLSVLSIHNVQPSDDQEINQDDRPNSASFEPPKPPQPLPPPDSHQNQSDQTQNSDKQNPVPPPTSSSSSSSSSNPNSSARNQFNPPSANSWAAWLPKVTDDGQIYYHNNLTGEVASEMPLADDELELEARLLPNQLNEFNQHKALSEFHLEDPLKFLHDNGFSLETLRQHGLLTSSPSSPTDRFTAINQSSTTSTPLAQLSTTPEPPNFYSSGSNHDEFDLPPQTHQSSPHDTSEPQLRTGLSHDLITPELTHDSRPHSLNYDRSSSSSSSNLQLPTSTATTTTTTTTTSSSGSGNSTTPNIFEISQQVKGKLKPIMEVPPTLTFDRMATEIKEAIALLTKLTEPTPENSNTDYPPTSPRTVNQTHCQHARDELSRASMNLVDKIRFLLQASCQLDTAVLSMMNDSSLAANTSTLSIGHGRRSSVSPISPFVSSSGDTTSLSAQYPSGSPFQNLFSNAHLQLPALKHVSRKIASTLSKLTLSTRALWGLLSIRPIDLFPPQTNLGDDSSSTTTPLDLQELNIRQNAQNRFGLEQKLRSECRMGVSDLSTSVDTFFHYFEGILNEQQEQQQTMNSNFAANNNGNDSRVSSSEHFPRHGHGHLVMPVESVFLPGGAQGGNWRASGYDPGLSFPSITDSSTPITGDPLSPLSKRSFSSPSIKLDSENLAQRFLPLIRQTRELAESIISLLAVDADEILISSEPTELNCIETLAPENADLLITQVLGLIETVGQTLSMAENLDLASTLEVDLDRFMWYELANNSNHHDLIRGLSDSINSHDSLNSIHHQLQFARRLVSGYQRSKQAVYDLAADLVYNTQTLLTSGLTNWASPSIPSPAQPLSASPLFTVHQYHSSLTTATPGRLVKTARRLVLSLESLGVAAAAIVQESTIQSSQDINLSGINQHFRNAIFLSTTTNNQDYNNHHHQNNSLINNNSITTSTTPSSESFPPNAIPRRLKSNSNATTSSSISSSNPFRNNNGLGNPPPSPRHQLHSRGIDEEQAELDRSTININANLALMNSHNRDNSIDGISITRKREPSILIQDADRPESASSKSPTRSKKLAKFFGEEAATSVILAPKPVSTKPAFLLPDYGPDDISFNVDNQIRGGTPRGLVVKLTSHEGPDVPFLRVFLMTYRTFTTSHDFLDLLIERYHQPPPPNLLAEELQLWTDQKQKVIKIRVINVIRSWIESHLSDEDADSIIQRVTEFSSHDMGDTNLARQVALTCERRQSRVALSKMTPMQAPGNPPPSIPPRNPRKIKFLDIDPLELARQLSLVESKLFCQIQANECLGKAWPKEFAKEGTPNIKAMIDMSNSLTRWVAETILLQPEQKKRASTIKHFILVADRCRSLNNFSTLMQIIAGLNSTPIYRLRRTWETIPQKTLTLFAQLGAVMSPTKNYAAYRDTIRNMAPPCVPFVGVYLTDWTFIGDGNPDQLREKPHQINFNKRQKAAELIVQIQSYQSMPYQLSPMPSIVKFLEESIENPRDETELYDLSLELEPRERDDEKIARLLAESGFL
ncbi:hypothetical protein MJO29_012441 [Puccinia striiformis f. sp. tritici]|uniref:Cell division control protein 25 n=2 Tax=Puccinia striiformis TaxID=27350 RepID=A0A0L0VKK5_9BASI|nr:hypothetical protein Pst134EA_033086 [Puccinia striiformis f. sp. tritici]KAI9623649.1 hypothetical protein H4Q26_014376 [Puccinia striiformis f. sp. tritici PST-130]KNE99509.1 hypothetical protein PSTG_07225 [Puccinia striiformis f. sp. tritici PST-78]POW07641.1 hypothetical protein PSHT_09876 [Puccinia striiformis]KAH9446107.1 hypothetical protein Pst134EB_033098 [Puccinia striiformis f. sp. tritici]KAH9455638.1 hypothetical protein Pst134EA_033086 [Puccinia striiformis f. sp. tritici]